MLATSDGAKLLCCSGFRRPPRASCSSPRNATAARHLRCPLASSGRKKRKRRALRKRGRALRRRLSRSPRDTFAFMKAPARCTASNFLSVFPLPIGHHPALAFLRQGVQTTLSAVCAPLFFERAPTPKGCCVTGIFHRPLFSTTGFLNSAATAASCALFANNWIRVLGDPHFSVRLRKHR